MTCKRRALPQSRPPEIHELARARSKVRSMELEVYLYFGEAVAKAPQRAA